MILVICRYITFRGIEFHNYYGRYLKRIFLLFLIVGIANFENQKIFFIFRKNRQYYLKIYITILSVSFFDTHKYYNKIGSGNKLQQNKIIMLPFLRNAGTDNKANTLNLAYKNLEEYFSDDYDYGDDIKVPNELNNIISNIHGESQLIELYAHSSKSYDQEYIKREVNLIKQNCFKLIKIINHLADLRMSEKKRLELCTSNVNIVEIIENLVINTSKHTKGNIIFDTNEEEKFMTCDINKLQKALLILLSTALKHSRDKEILVKLNIFKDRVRLDISFNNKDKKLKDFFRDKMDKPSYDDLDGLSLDLFLSKYLIGLQEGSVSVGGNEGQTVFTLELPCNNKDSVHYLYWKDTDNEYLDRQIQIEFSDFLNPYD